jgi:hypothetical protein
MKQLGISAALGGSVLGTWPAPVRAAEWSITPAYTATMDYDSNRQLRADSTGSGGGFLYIDLKFQRALEDLRFALEPTYSFRRYTDPRYGNGDDRTLISSMSWDRETSSLSVNASYLDQSTLITEVLETGIVSGDTHRRTAAASAGWNWSQTERRMLVAQASYSDVSYYGTSANVLPGYKYTAGSVGERFTVTERASFTLGVYGDILKSPTPGNSSREYGLQGELTYQLSERTNVDAQIGESRRNLSGAGSYGTTISVKLGHSFALSKLSAEYTRSLVPYGVGFLVERQQYSAALSRPFNEFVDVGLTYTHVQNNEAAVLVLLDRRSYSDLQLSVNWHPAETFVVSLRGDAGRSEIAGLEGQTVSQWRGALALTWAPHPSAKSW